MVCAWKSAAVPCSEAHNLFYMNQNFFVVSNEDIKKETTARPFGGKDNSAVEIGPKRANSRKNSYWFTN